MESRIAVYARVAAAGQTGERSVEQQVERLQAYARQHSWTVAPERVYRDEGVSGRPLERPGLRGLRAAVARSEIDVVLVTDPDRLARDATALDELLNEFERAEVAVVFRPRH
ncbi:MAG: recombinase family protein [Dehalococcoidia bacterium]